MKNTIILVLLAAALLLAGTTLVGTYTVTGQWDASGATHTLPIKKGTAASKPATCTQGEEYFATDSTAGQNEWYCTATNTWTQQTGGGGSSANGTMTLDFPCCGSVSGSYGGPFEGGGVNVSGSTYLKGYMLTNTGTPTLRAAFRLPANFDKTKTVTAYATGFNPDGVGGNVSLKVSIGCYVAGDSALSDPTQGTTLTFATISQGGTNLLTAATPATLSFPAACDSDIMAQMLVWRDNTVGSNLAGYYYVNDIALTYGTK